MGTSLLSVPWALSQSGLIMGLAIAIGMSLIAAYTASIILKTHSKESKYTQLSADSALIYIYSDFQHNKEHQ